MRDVEQYFDAIDSALTRSSAQEVEASYTPLSRTSGIVDGVLYFADGSRLEFTELVHIVNRKPMKTLYRYQYIRGGEGIFRYDNALHHPNLLNFPHHKHVGRKKIPATAPTLSQVLDEVSVLMNRIDGAVPSSRKRRRP